MNDDELPIHAELASAYLDGELDADERASVGADPDVAPLIESFAQVRAALGEVGPVAESTKASAIAAALAEYDALHARGSAVAPVTSLRSRRLRAYRVVTGVAAAAVVAVVAIAALNSAGGNDTKSSSGTAQPAAALPAETPQLKSTAETAAAAATVAPASAADGASVQIPAIDTDVGLRQYAASFGFAAPAPAGTAAPAATRPASDQSVEAATSSAASAPLPCLTPDQVVIGPIFFQATPAIAVRVGSTGHIQALDATDCRVLADVAP